MNRRTDLGNFFLLDALNAAAHEADVSVLDAKAKEHLLHSLSNSLDEHQKHAARIHGFRTQSMFAHVAAGLGQCEIITEEDSGFFFDHSGKLRRPDFRIKTRSSGQMLVEVKNHHHNEADPFAPLIVKPNYLESVKSYARSFGMPLKFAIFWSSWNLWTLLDADRFSESEATKISPTDAIQENEMYLLGDSMLGTIPPLSIRAFPVESTVQVDGSHVTCNVERGFVMAGGRELRNPTDSQLAVFLMLYGSWETHEAIVVRDDDGRVAYIESRVEPPEQPEQEEGDFAPMRTFGFKSSMLSTKFRFETTENGCVTKLAPTQIDNDSNILVSAQSGAELPIWDFTVVPRSIDREKYLKGLRRSPSNSQPD